MHTQQMGVNTGKAKQCGYEWRCKENTPNMLNLMLDRKQKTKGATEEMEANGEQTFQIGTFDVGEEELDPGGRL